MMDNMSQFEPRPTLSLELAADSLEKANTPQPFSSSRTSNWVARRGGLPPYVQHIAHALVKDGHPESNAIAIAIGAVKRWAGGGGKVDKNTRSAASEAVGQWESMKGRNKAADAGRHG